MDVGDERTPICTVIVLLKEYSSGNILDVQVCNSCLGSLSFERRRLALSFISGLS